MEHYCLHFNLKKFIRFGTVVELVEPVQEDGTEKWRVTSRKNESLVWSDIAILVDSTSLIGMQRS